MNLAADLAEVFADFATWCEVQGKEEDAPRSVFMVVRGQSSGSINSRDNLLAFIDKTTLPRGANWGYGVIMAADAPAGMNEESRLMITDASGEIWECESAKPFYGVNEETHQKELVAWRMALRGKQRMVRGR